MYIGKMTYNKTAIYKYREANREQFCEIAIKASSKYRNKNIEMCREKDRLSKRPLATAFRILRKMDIF